MSKETPRTSVVIPVFNEAECLPELHRRLREVLDGIPGSAEIIFIDDGSSDASPRILEDLAKSDPEVGVVRFSRNFGQHYAMTSGFDHCRGDRVVLMDADLQDRPEEIPRLIEKLEEGFDVVYGIRQARRDPFFRRMASRGLIWLLRRSGAMTLEWDVATFRVMSRRVVDALVGMRERSRFIAGLVSWLGFASAAVEVEHGERAGGASKYRLKSLVRLAVTALTGFSYAPLRIATWMGFAVSLVAFGWAVVLLVRRLLLDITSPGYASIMVAILFIGGVQLIVLGIIGEYLGRIYSEVQQRPLYVVTERLGVLRDHEPRA